MENRPKEYYYILRAHGFPATRFETKEELIAFIEKHKIPYTKYIIDRCEK